MSKPLSAKKVQTKPLPRHARERDYGRAYCHRCRDFHYVDTHFTRAMKADKDPWAQGTFCDQCVDRDFAGRPSRRPKYTRSIEKIFADGPFSGNYRWYKDTGGAVIG